MEITKACKKWTILLTETQRYGVLCTCCGRRISRKHDTADIMVCRKHPDHHIAHIQCFVDLFHEKESLAATKRISYCVNQRRYLLMTLLPSLSFVDRSVLLGDIMVSNKTYMDVLKRCFIN